MDPQFHKNNVALNCHSFAVASALLLALCMGTNPLWACEPSPEGVVSVLIPGDGAPVSTNATIQIEIAVFEGSPYRAPGLLLQELNSTEAVPLEVEEFDLGDSVYWHAAPVMGFVPDTSYIFTVAYDEDMAVLFSESTFETAELPDEDIPLSIEAFEPEGDFHKSIWNTCTGRTATGIVMAELPSLMELGGDYYEIEAGSEEDLSDATTIFTQAEGFRFGTDEMGIGRGGKAYVRVRPVDLSGNAGPWTETEDVQIPLCAMAQGTPSGLLSFLFIGLAAFIGGRRTSSPHSPKQSSRS